VNRLPSVQGFDWDDGNLHKNLGKHGVTHSECEQPFFNRPLIINDDPAHGDDAESRYLALGRTDQNRRLFIVFTVRGKLIRIISARDMTPKERALYEAHK
jgi:uncharacterized DUF497 family protein